MAAARMGCSQGPFGFAGGWGYQEDVDSGLKLLGHRYYDASTGRFLTRDPVKDGRNWYGYAGNEPTVGIDPSGHFWLIIALIVAAVVLVGCNKDSASGAGGTAVTAPLPPGASEGTGALGAPAPTTAIAREKAIEKRLAAHLEDDPNDDSGDPYSGYDQDGDRSGSTKVKGVLRKLGE